MKIKNYLFILAAMSAIVLSCSDDDDGDGNGNQTGPPVETLPANTDYEPAFEGQTRIDGVITTTDYESRVVTSNLEAPWGVTSLPDGRLLITEKEGNMRIVTTTGTVSSAITGIPAVNAAGQGGLLGLCIDPQFASNRMVYWAFSENVGGGTLTAVAKGRLADDEKSIENATVIYRANPAYPSDLHYGGRVIFDRSGNLFISTGERSVLPTRPLAQSVEAALGKIIRITTDGQPASGNPTFSGNGALPELYSIGHRNPQGIALHPETGDLWQAEHGPRGGDELNRVRAGANYGWPTITYGIEYSGETIGDGIQQKDGMEQPVYYWDPVISPSGITFYKGDRVPEWKNNLFLSSLSGKHIIRLVIDDNRVVGEERLLASEGQRFRDITQGTDNALYAVTDEGRLYRIDRKTDAKD
ncbi:PQQ-dependent sugar dehydrogenase [Parachryseolinea silvisoli]|uniref:PQQ-dependent sugar dehydrogenase n=1 Tax=Parachryseolinea silvisoli TaxID=2873601 RepID=UPI002265E82D|nr:PQQ-dependent sugar dehydrogenase [Parachryseolinea silvisoli]MCD9014191.1 PQQ-dependent sugar dehydrogenase [Parachryseolinea silvisoli]